MYPQAWVQIMFLPKIPGGLPYITANDLRVLLWGHKRVADAVSYLVAKGELIRLKRGFFILAHHPLTEAGALPLATISNLLYGPSYVSKQWVLSYKGLIPEFASTMTCISLPRSKRFTTPIGSFDYTCLNQRDFHLGVETEIIDGFKARVATLEKALLDLLAQLPALGNLAAMEHELLESMRIDPVNLKSLNKELVTKIALVSNRTNSKLFARYLNEC